MHEMGYTISGDNSFYKLTPAEIRVLAEGYREHQRAKARQNGQTEGTGPHERVKGEPRESDKQWVQELAEKES